MTSEFSKKANIANPISIVVGDFVNSYDPIHKKISLNINSEFINYFGEEGVNGEKYKLSILTHPHLAFELDEYSIKGTIYHELAHWLDDTILDSRLKKEIENNFKKYKKNGEIDYTFLHYYSAPEINAIIHAIKALKQKYSQAQWDTRTFEELLKQKANSFGLLNKVMEKGKNMYGRWMKKFINRLAREQLLGIKMGKISFEKAKELYSSGYFGDSYKKL